VRDSRRFSIAVAVSVVVHALIFAIPVREKVGEALMGSVPLPPLTVHIVEAPRPAEVAPQPEAAPEVAPVPRVRPPVVPRFPAPPRPSKAIEPPPPPPVEEPLSPPKVDMMAMIEARRAQRRAAEAAAARGQEMREPTPEEAAAAAINRNLRRSPNEGVSGVFQILHIGTRTAEFAFNGWRSDSERQWREVIEVDAGLNGDVELAVVRRMIQLIRTHYQGDFNWESHRLGRVVVLSARAEDNSGLEDFLMREFFGIPTVRPGRP
jgi:hypothetical protein